mmetsp:Transcript_69735/g.159928  ORF Transcript_69735/g.159928 Transcript_69735/m.159928 type:complete len:366 (-) Transcript_69735:155-1252(-)
MMGMMGGMMSGMLANPELMAMFSSGEAPPAPDPNGSRAAFGSTAAQVIPADVIMFSGCKDDQTSADVHNVASFGLPPDAGPGGAGGACTNAMMLALSQNASPTWIELLESMRVILEEKKFTQVPQLASSKEIMLNAKYDLKLDNGSGRTKALMVGINYVGHKQGVLNGCHNDVLVMKQFIVEQQGFDENNIKVLMDDGQHQNPEKENIMNGIRWLIDGAQSGDSLFMHYSGHGTQMKDDDGDEADGMDEALCPVDYPSAGMIRDDDMFRELVATLPAGCRLTVVMDCCHSGSILDLPYSFTASAQGVQNFQSESGGTGAIPANGAFNWTMAFGVGMQLYNMHKNGASMSELAAEGQRAMKAFMGR